MQIARLATGDNTGVGAGWNVTITSTQFSSGFGSDVHDGDPAP
ncbi:MAG: hypothetical protein ACYCXY_11440 [Acidimicrobiales bacterium]